MSGLGHNQGPTMEGGTSWRKHCWGKARKALLPQLPLEVIRGRVRRAKELVLPYQTYATVRASSGRDIIAFLFSSNALRLLKYQDTLPAERVQSLSELQNCDKLLAVNIAVPAQQLAERLAGAHNIRFDASFAAPAPLTDWSSTATVLRDALLARKLPSDTVLLVGDTEAEKTWLTAGRLAGYLKADQFFPSVSGA